MAVCKLLVWVVMLGEAHQLDGDLKEMAEWLDRRRATQAEAFGAIIDVRAMQVSDINEKLQCMLWRWRIIMDEETMSVSHLSEEGLELSNEHIEEETAKYSHINVRGLGDEGVCIEFNRERGRYEHRQGAASSTEDVCSRSAWRVRRWRS